MAATTKREEGRDAKRREPPPGNGGSQNIGAGFNETRGGLVSLARAALLRKDHHDFTTNLL